MLEIDLYQGCLVKILIGEKGKNLVTNGPTLKKLIWRYQSRGN